MLKSILNLKGVTSLSKNEQKSLMGSLKPTDDDQHPKCDNPWQGTYATISACEMGCDGTCAQIVGLNEICWVCVTDPIF